MISASPDPALLLSNKLLEAEMNRMHGRIEHEPHAQALASTKRGCLVFLVIVGVLGALGAGGASALLGLFLASASTKPWPRSRSMLAALVGMVPGVALGFYSVWSWATSEPSIYSGMELFFLGPAVFSVIAHLIAGAANSGYLIGMAAASNLVIASPVLMLALDPYSIAVLAACLGTVLAVVAFAVPSLLRCTFKRPEPPAYPPQQMYPPYPGY